MSNVQNNINISEYRNILNQEKEKLNVFLGEHGLKVFTSLSVVFIFVIYFLFFYKRISRSLNRMKKRFRKYKNIIPLERKYDIFNKNYVLSDFYVASSYKCYLPCTNYIDYSSIKSIEAIIKSGARFLDIDIMNSDFQNCAEPVVCYGKEVGNWQYTNSLPLKEVLHTISLLAFSHHVENMTDPFYININFKTWYNKSTINKTAEFIKTFFSGRLLSSEYSYQGRLSKVNIGTQPIKDFLAKLILVSPNNLKDTDMDELVNINTSSENLRTETYDNVKDTADPQELIEFNKKNFTMAIPPVKTREKKNQNFWTAYYFGCQFLCMNYTKPDVWMMSYIEHFQNCSFVLKPFKLRYKPIYINKPDKSTSINSNGGPFKPKKLVTPTYEITY